MPTVALCSICAMDRSLADAAALAARCGADGFEVTARAPHLEASAGPDEVRTAGERIRASGLEVTAYGSYLSYTGPSYEVDAGKASRFATAVGRYLPEIRAEHLAPEFAGVRPKLQGPGEPFRDFVIAEESSQGFPGLVNLIGIESPGLTAAGEIAERVAELV